MEETNNGLHAVGGDPMERRPVAVVHRVDFRVSASQLQKGAIYAAGAPAGTPLIA